MNVDAARLVRCIARRTSFMDHGARAVPEEVPVALSYGGTTQAVMMASPADLEDFAYGFTHPCRITVEGKVDVA